ncbi:SDR family NAD(P)-dependent oxidoreductase [Melittangium boletus]|uniref:SDR family NAD(P)-dependent oxidoreductase n=1 Tax=Melittangium boletus TaxID=83453 RepID=UPI003DA54686
MSGLKDLRGKVAVVTGGTSGIGKGLAKQLIAEGMQVVIASKRDDALQATAREIGAVGIQTDVSDLESVRALARAVCERFGTVHVVCNNAGVGPFGRIADLSVNDWKWVLDVNLWGCIHGVNVFLPILKANPEGGHFVNTSSLGGFTTHPNLGAYAVSKFGMMALSETLAQELAEEGSKVGVTLLCPGPVYSDIKSSSRNRPESLQGGGLVDVDLQSMDFAAHARWLEPDEVGRMTVEAIKKGELYVITHPESFAGVDQRHQAIARAFQREPAP